MKDPNFTESSATSPIYAVSLQFQTQRSLLSSSSITLPYNASSGNAPIRIPGLYLPTKQWLEMFIFGSPYIGLLDPGDHQNCVSLQLYDKLQEHWPENYPRSTVPLSLSPEGPGALHLPKDDCSASFIVGSQGWRILKTTATRAIAGEFNCAARNGLNSDSLQFLYQSLDQCGFESVNSLVDPLQKAANYVLRFSQSSPLYALMPGQKLLHMEEGKHLVVAAQPSTGIPSGIVTIIAASEDDHGAWAHLATIAFRESTMNADKIMNKDSCNIKMLVISHQSDLEATIGKFLPSGPTSPAIQIFEARDLNAQYNPAHSYNHVVRMLDLLGTDLSRVPVRNNDSIRAR